MYYIFVALILTELSYAEDLNIFFRTQSLSVNISPSISLDSTKFESHIVQDKSFQISLNSWETDQWITRYSLSKTGKKFRSQLKNFIYKKNFCKKVSK